MNLKLAIALAAIAGTTADVSAQNKTTAPGLVFRPYHVVSCNLSEITRAGRAALGPEITPDRLAFSDEGPITCPSCPTKAIADSRRKRDKALAAMSDAASQLAALEWLRENVLACEAAGY